MSTVEIDWGDLALLLKYAGKEVDPHMWLDRAALGAVVGRMQKVLAGEGPRGPVVGVSRLSLETAHGHLIHHRDECHIGRAAHAELASLAFVFGKLLGR